MSDKKDYNNIFKSTFLFGFVQVFNIAVKVGLNKAVALILGPTGLGVISLYNTAIQMVSTGAGLGINQSGVRDISEARAQENLLLVSTTITFVKRIIRYTSLLGIVLMTVLSPWLSEWTFGCKSYTIPYILLSLATGATIQTKGYQAINTGMKQLRNVALSTVWGSVAALVSALPLYFLFGDNGIVPSLIISSMATLFIARYYADKVTIEKVKMTFKEALHKSSNMIRMGISLMLMSFMLSLTQLILSSYVSNYGGLRIVGVYQAGATIVASYFGIIITAMSTEYYPRISGFYYDNIKLKEAVNSQCEVGLLLALPLIVMFEFLCPYFVKILYSEKFIDATQYLDYAIIGTVSSICSNSMGMILLAKQNAKVFLLSSLIINIIVLGVNILLYNNWGLLGLGFGYAFNGLFQLVIYSMIMNCKYKITLSKLVIVNLIISIFLCIISMYIREINACYIRWLCGSLLFIVASSYSLLYMKKNMEIDIFSLLFHRIKRN